MSDGSLFGAIVETGAAIYVVHKLTGKKKLIRRKTEKERKEWKKRKTKGKSHAKKL